MWWQDLLWGMWNGFSAWRVVIVHWFGGWQGQPMSDAARTGGWYNVAFLGGAGSPFLGFLWPCQRKKK